MAALQYRVRFGDDKSHFGSIPNMLRELIPHEILLGGKRDSEATEGSDDLAVARRRIGRAGVRLVLGEFMHGCKGSKYVEAINLATEVLVGGKGLLPACLLEGEGKRRLFAVSGGNGQIELPEHQHDDGLEVA